MQKICILRLSSMGDILLTTPFIRALRNKYPNARIDMVISSTFAPLMLHNPRLNTIWQIDTSTGLIGLLRQYIALRRSMPYYDLVIDLHCSLRSRILRQGIGHTLFETDKYRQFKKELLRTHRSIPVQEIIPVPLRYFSALKNSAWHIEPDNMGLEFWLPDQDKDYKAVVNQQELYSDIPLAPAAENTHDKKNNFRIAVAPGAHHATKCWPAEYFGRLLQLLAAAIPHAEFVLVGGKNDSDAAHITLSNAGAILIENHTGRHDLYGTAQILDTCSMLICNDSGLMHMAAARHIPTAVIFGSTVPGFGFIPYGIPHIIIENHQSPCRPCTHIGRSHCPLQHFSCMKELYPQDVAQRILSFIDTLPKQ